MVDNHLHTDNSDISNQVMNPHTPRVTGSGTQRKTTIPSLGKKKKSAFTNPKEYKEYKHKRKQKKKAKKEKKKKSSSSWWDTLLDIGGKVLTHILPMFLGGKQLQYGSMSAHSGPRVRTIVPANSIPAAQPESFHPSSEPEIQSLGPGKILIRHSGLAGTLNSANDAGDYFVRGTRMYGVDLTPFIEPWLARMSAYQRFRFRNIAVTVHPSVPTLQAGRIMGYFEDDVDNPVVTGAGETTIESAASMAGAVITDVWEAHTFVKSFRDTELYYVAQTGVEPRTSKQGRFNLVAASDFDNSFPANIADITIAYEIILEEPVLQAPGVLGAWAVAVDDAVDRPTGVIFGRVPTYDYMWKRTDGESIMWDMSPVQRSFTPSYSGVSFGAGTQCSAFQLPSGYWCVDLYVEGTNLAAFDDAPSGNYCVCGLKSAGFSWYYTSATKWCHKIIVLSTGFNDPMSFLKISCTYDTITKAYIQFTCLGGSPEMPTASQVMFERVKKLSGSSSTSSTSLLRAQPKILKPVASGPEEEVKKDLSFLKSLKLASDSSPQVLQLGRSLALKLRQKAQSCPEEIRVHVENLTASIIALSSASDTAGSATSSSK